MTTMTTKRNLFQVIGPGLLMAGAAIGVSHLVQATRAGAEYGFQLLVIVVLVNVLKYPFFEYGHRYPAATGENLLAGYRKLGPGFVEAFLLLTVISGLSATAGVTFVAAGLAQHLFGLDMGTTAWSALLMGACATLLVVGRYRWLDLGMRGIMATLSIATVVAFIVAANHGGVAPGGFEGPSPWTQASVGFLVALMGWMPAPIEVSAWQSLWIEARDHDSGHHTDFAEARLDFNFGYGLTVFLAVLFLGLGTLLMYGSGVEIQNSSGGFAAQLVDLYQQTLGGWSGPLIAAAAFTTILSTTLTVVDAYPRSMAVGLRLLWPSFPIRFRLLYSLGIVTMCGSALLIIDSFLNQLTAMVDFATTIAFLAGPIYGFLNYRLLTSIHTPQHMHPGPVLRIISWMGMIFGALFGLFFLVYPFAPQVLP